MIYYNNEKDSDEGRREERRGDGRIERREEERNGEEKRGVERIGEILHFIFVSNDINNPLLYEK